jgi:hypothetical protein
LTVYDVSSLIDSIRVVEAFNTGNEFLGDDGLSLNIFLKEYDMGNNIDSVYAVWSKSVAVPAPGTIILLALGLAGLPFFRYRKQS